MAVTRLHKSDATTVLVDKLYPLIVKFFKSSNGKSRYMKLVSEFMAARQEQMYAVAPFDRIYFTQKDVDLFFEAIGITQAQVANIISETFYASISNYNPSAAKDELTMTAMMIIRYFVLNKMDKELELALIYLSFSGKIYPSCHSGSFPKVVPRQYEYVMLYAVNSLSNKYDLKATGSVIGTVKSIATTWVQSYKDEFKDKYDETYCYLLQQLHNRIKSFIKNIAEIYYKAYEDRNYITYDSDDISSDGENTRERLIDNNSLKLERYVSNTLNRITTEGVDYNICQMSADTNVKVNEIKSIVETIISNPDNIPTITEFLRLIIGTYLEQAEDKNIKNMEFLAYIVKSKPNSKDKNVIRQKEIVEEWLDVNSPAYRKRKNREPTRLSYHKAMYKYFMLSAYYAN